MSKIAFVFPGQGAQAVGMGKDFVDQPAARRVYEAFDAKLCNLNPSLSTVCFEGPEETLKRTLYTQPAILATSIAALELFKERSDLQPDYTAGHSLGEYGALYAVGCIDLDTAAILVGKRAELMEAAPPGAMSAVMGLDVDKIEAVLGDYRAANTAVVVIANYNTDNQVVISGDPVALEAVAAPLKEAGAKRVLSLPVGGAFHSPLMAEPAQQFAAFLSTFTFNEARVPVITNVDAALTQAGADVQQKLGHQIDHSVHWMQTMQRIHEEGVRTVIEFGPGKVLTGMIRKAYPDIALFNVFDMISLEEAIAALSEPARV